jgi:hypothetical protein
MGHVIVDRSATALLAAVSSERSEALCAVMSCGVVDRQWGFASEGGARV